MRRVNTYNVKRNGANIWLAQYIEPLDTDEVIKIIPVVIAEEGYLLYNHGECIGAFTIDKGYDYEEVKDELVDNTDSSDTNNTSLDNSDSVNITEQN